MKKLQIICVVVILSLGINSYSQGVADKIALEEYNSNLLDSLVFDEVVKQRKENDLAGLFVSESMLDSARHHSKRMSELDKIFYKDIKRGQCPVAMEMEVREFSYLELSRIIVKRWMSSPGHRKLILGAYFIYGASSNHIVMKDDKLFLKGVFYLSYNP